MGERITKADLQAQLEEFATRMKSAEDSADTHRRLLRDLSRMAEPAIVAHLRGQIIALHEALGLRKGDVLASRTLNAQWDVLERYGLNPALCAVLFDNNPEGRISVSPSESGTMIVSGRNQAEIFLRPDAIYPLLHLNLRHENAHRIQLSSYLVHEGALKAIDSLVLSNADAFLKRVWRLDAPGGITEEYRNSQALIWSVEHLAHGQGLLKTPLHPHYDRDILTVKHPVRVKAANP